MESHWDFFFFFVAHVQPVMKSSCNVALTEKSFESLFKDVPVKKDPSVQKASCPIPKRIVGKFLNVRIFFMLQLLWTKKLIGRRQQQEFCWTKSLEINIRMIWKDRLE